jgi:hypothetical protein
VQLRDSSLQAMLRCSRRGPPVAEELLSRRLPGDLCLPAKTTIHAVLDRHGLVKQMGKRRARATGTPLSKALALNDLWCADFKGEFKLGNGRYSYLKAPLSGPAGPRIPFHDRDVLVTALRPHLHLRDKRINVSTVLAGQRIWLVTFIDYDLGYIDLEQRTLQTLDNPFGPRLSPLS